MSHLNSLESAFPESSGWLQYCHARYQPTIDAHPDEALPIRAARIALRDEQTLDPAALRRCVRAMLQHPRIAEDCARRMHRTITTARELGQKILILPVEMDYVDQLLQYYDGIVDGKADLHDPFFW